jgi:hypothetical protein
METAVYEKIATFLACSEPDRRARGSKLPPGMPAIRPLVTGAVRENEGVVWSDATPRDVDSNINCAFMTHAIDDVGEASPTSLPFFWVKSLTPTEARGRVQGFYPLLCRMHYCQLELDTATFGVAPEMYFGRKQGQWRFPAQTSGRYRSDVARTDRSTRLNAPGTGGDDNNFSPVFTMACSVQFDSYFKWQVELGYEGGPRISFWTDPHGACEAFRLRDIPAGKHRRSALAHWVRSHWRQNRSGSLTEIRKHLRGACDFRWSGLTCRIVPSQSDLKELAQ